MGGLSAQTLLHPCCLVSYAALQPADSAVRVEEVVEEVEEVVEEEERRERAELQSVSTCWDTLLTLPIIHLLVLLPANSLALVRPQILYILLHY